MKTVEIFRTDVIKDDNVSEIIRILLEINSHYKINFDFYDQANILRIEVHHFIVDIDEIIKSMTNLGYSCTLIK